MKRGVLKLACQQTTNGTVSLARYQGGLIEFSCSYIVSSIIKCLLMLELGAAARLRLWLFGGPRVPKLAGGYS